MTFNARSLCNKTVGVTEFLTGRKCDICFISEAWLKLKDTSVIAEIKQLGYNVKFQPRKGSRRGGGVCVLFKEHINVQKCNIKSYKTFEILEVIINGNNDLLRVSTFYRTGKMTAQGRIMFTNDLDDYLGNLMQKKGEKLLCGDFNIHVQNNDNLDTKTFYSVTESYGFCQLVNSPTHRDGATLDLVFIQKQGNYRSLIQNSLLIHDLCFSLTSDHNFIEFTVPFKKETVEMKHIELSYRDFKNVDVEAFCSDVIEILNSKPTNFFTEEINTAASLFNNALTQTIEKHAPIINTSVKSKKTPFTNRDIIVLRQKRRKAERSFRKHKNPNDKKQYQSLVKDVRKLVKNTMNEYYDKELIAAKDNKKKRFKTFNKMLGKQQEVHLPAHENVVELCQDFENYFYTKIQNIRSKINGSSFEIIKPVCSSSIDTLTDFTCLGDDDVLEIINGLSNKHCELDPVSSELFKKCIPYFLPYVKYIINTSLESGSFPTSFKEALIKPKLKSYSLDKDMLNNYRPLSNLSFLSKALERCVLKQLVKHLESNSLFNDCQSAYRKFHSCETAITKITNDILLSLDNKQCSFLLFLDLSAAFDTVDHSILLSTLETKYGIKGFVLQWFNSYLSNRNYKVTINKCSSTGIFLFFGVPQGSILGPILFILYISDIEYIAKCHGFRIHIYADDTQLYISFEKFDMLSTVSDVEHCLREIKCWMSNNFLKLNEEKTKFLLISSEEDLHNIYVDLCISFSGNIISPSLDAVNLGVTFDSTMTMQTYINNIISNGYNHLSNFWKATSKLTKDLKLQLVSSYILPLIDYCNITFLAASKSNVGKLQKLLNSAVRYIFNLSGKRYQYSITPYLKKLHVLPVEYRVKYKVALMVYKCFHDLAPSYLKELIVPKVTYSHLRSSNDVYSLQTVIPKSHYGESSFSYAAPLIWNELPNDVKLTPTLECFKKRLKSHYFIEHFGND